MKFEKVSLEAFRKDMLKCGWAEEIINDAYENITLPQRKTKYSVGYDFATPVSCLIRPQERVVIPTGIKVYFTDEEAEKIHLKMYIRSSVGIKDGIVLSNGTGIIDGDYYGNPDNEGDMMIAIVNTGKSYKLLKARERLVQGVFERHYIIIGDDVEKARMGGIGSTEAI